MRQLRSRGASSGWSGTVLIIGVMLLTSTAVAHPLSQGAMDVTVFPDRVAVRARVTIEEVVVTNMLTTTNAPATPAAGEGTPATGSVYARHAAYLAQHVTVTADGIPLVGRVTSATPPATRPAGGRGAPDEEHVVYELEYVAAGGAAPMDRPTEVSLRHDVLVGLEFAPGVTWETSYAVRIRADGGPVTEGLLLTAPQPVVYACEWGALPGSPAGQAETVRVDAWRTVRDYASHGVHHILSGYDHLLFISALVLAASRLWDLVKVVTAFTLAHTLTLTLATLHLVTLPEWVVEPMIAASIVFVAAQNVFWPKQTRGTARLAVAFGFGLFHGLGFAGGLLDATQDASATTVALALAAFSLGVEIGHQLIVIPLFGLLRLARRTSREAADRDRVSMLALRYGSGAICAAGMYYLVGAVGSALSVAVHT